MATSDLARIGDHDLFPWPVHAVGGRPLDLLDDVNALDDLQHRMVGIGPAGLLQPTNCAGSERSPRQTRHAFRQAMAWARPL